MARLSLFLPPAAGDYSGAASTLFGLDCLVVIVDAGCCTRNYAEYDEPRWARRRKTAFSAQLRTLEAVMGDDARIVAQAADATRELGVSCAALLGTPVPAVTGMDLPGIAREVEDEAGVPVLGIETCGFETYEHGVSHAQEALVRRFAQAGPETGKGVGERPLRVNVLGLSPHDFLGAADMDACLAWLRDEGLEVAFAAGGSYTLDGVAAAGKADASVVVSWAGLAAARWLRDACGVPYVVGRPWCPADASSLAGLVARVVGASRPEGAHSDVPLRLWDAPTGAPDTGEVGRDVREEETRTPGEAPTELLIVGEQVAACSLRAHIRAAYAGRGGAVPRVTVATIFSADAALAEGGDLAGADEEGLVAWAAAHPGFAWVGDPLLARIPGFAGRALAELPHEALSSTLYADYAATLAGEGALALVRSAIIGGEAPGE